MGKKKFGLVLGSGVGHTIADVGVIKALQEAGIEADLVAGTSGGSIVGAFYAAGLPYRHMEEFAKGLRWRKLFRLPKPDRGILSSQALAEHLDKFLAGRKFRDLKRPLFVVASDLVSGEQVVLDSPEMKVSQAVAASCAVPVIFRPVEYQGMVLVDGAVRNKLPVDVARERGAEFVLAIGPQQKDEVPAGELDNIFQLANRLIGLVGLEKARRSEREADMVVRISTEGVSPWDLKAALGLIENAETQMKAKLPLLRKKLKGKWWQRLLRWSAS